MKLNEFISLEAIYIDIDADSKKLVFKEIASIISKKSSLKPSLIIEKLNEREKLGSTGVGNGVAIPHTKIEGIKKTYVIFLKLKNAVDFSSSDKKEVDLVFPILTSEDSKSEHLLILSSISVFLKKKREVEKLRHLNSAEDILNLFSKY